MLKKVNKCDMFNKYTKNRKGDKMNNIIKKRINVSSIKTRIIVSLLVLIFITAFIISCISISTGTNLLSKELIALY